MAEFIGIGSGIITLVSLTHESSNALYRSIQSLQNKERTVRELRDEVQDLEGVLRTLKDSIANLGVDIEALERPLKRCCNACNDFTELIKKCTERSTDQRTSIKDWRKLRYMGDDLAGFKNVLAGYKSTITIALAYANIRKTNSTKDILDEYKELIENTKYDLEVHLQEIKNKLESTIIRDQMVSEGDTAELRMMEEERDSTQQCLKICSQVSAQIEQAQPASLKAMKSPPNLVSPDVSLAEPSLPWFIMAEGFNSAQKDFISSKLGLQQYLHGINSQLQTTRTHLPLTQAVPAGEQRTLDEDADSTKESLSICDRAANQENEVRTHFFEDISIGEGGQQVIVTTLKDLISAKRISAGSKSIQVMGQMSDASLQFLSLGHHYSINKEAK